MGKPTGFFEYAREPIHDRPPLERLRDWDEMHLAAAEETLRGRRASHRPHVRAACNERDAGAESGQRAVSLHIYSRPFNRCLVYRCETDEYREIPLHYTSEYGKLCEGEKL